MTPHEALAARYATVPLTKGKVAIVDAADAERVRTYNWFAHESNRTWYAYFQVRENGKRRRVRMHDFIVGTSIPQDHINGDGLDNRRENLRPATSSQNSMNRRKRRGARSPYKGVSWHSRAGTWRAYIKLNGRREELGGFGTDVEAAHAYDAAATQYFGEYAALNFPAPANIVHGYYPLHENCRECLTGWVEERLPGREEVAAICCAAEHPSLLVDDTTCDKGRAKADALLALLRERLKGENT